MSEQPYLSPVFPPSTNPMPGVPEVLFVHADHTKAEAVAAVCAEDFLGAVYALPKNSPSTRERTLRRAIQTHRSVAGPQATILADADLYSGKNRVMGEHRLDQSWVAHQLNVGLTVACTDSGFINDATPEQLVSVLNQAAGLPQQRSGRVLTLLPLGGTWVTQRADALRAQIERAQVPVALLLGSAKDPLGSRLAVEGLLHVLESEVPVSLLRTDMAAVGALAGGASIAAIGTRSGLRHIYPVRESKGGPPAALPSALVPQSLSLHRLDTLAEAIADSPDALHWICRCNRCYDRSLITIRSEEHAFAHNLSAAAEIARHVLNGLVRSERLASWAALCGQAQFVNMEIAATTNRRWVCPAYLGAWWIAGQPSLVGQ
jgi:hypothetical protein